MKNGIVIAMVAALMLTVPSVSVFSADVFMTKTELIQYNPDKAFDGYNLFVNNGSFWLIDMEGRVVNSWDPHNVEEAPFGLYAYFLENGNLRAHLSPNYAPGGVLMAGGVQGRIAEYDWEGNRVWYMDVFDRIDHNGDGKIDENDMAMFPPMYGFGAPSLAYTGTYRFHHDAQRMYNSKIGKWTYLVLIWAAKDEADADNMGIARDQVYRSRSKADNPDTPDVDESQLATWSPCALVEILPDYASGVGGDIIWYWTFADHMVTTDPQGTAATEEWVDYGGRISRPPLVVSKNYASGPGDTDSIEGNPQLLDVNGMHYYEPGGPTTDYQHCNSFDYNEELGYIAINAKACNEFFVIDHDGTFDPDATANDWSDVGQLARGTGGDFLYRYGNPGNYYSGEPAKLYNEGDMEMYGTHDIQWIMDYHWRPPMNANDTWEDPALYGTQYMLPGGGLTDTGAARGVGHFLMFDNGCYNPLNAGSKVIELNPYMQGGDLGESIGVDANGNPQYVWMATGTRIPDPDNGSEYTVNESINNPTGLVRRDQVAWEYSAGINDFYSSYISGQTRMPNGNTIICAGSHSHFFEVTPDKEVVWEYVMPPYIDPDRVTNMTGAVISDGPEPGAFQSTKSSANMCFRMHRFAADHPALKGRDLTPGDTLTGFIPATLDSGSGDTIPVPPPAPSDPLGSLEITGSGGGGGGGGAGGDGGY